MSVEKASSWVGSTDGEIIELEDIARRTALKIVTN